ncbi:MAG TPA: redoxin domain-containing protein [Solirubrobacteraceae bacterium]|nr:redoxin domain-containing protein [Solirubrobacteraceae bacterium]
MRLRALIAVLLAIAGCVALPALACADGDPGSDVLLDQNLFYGSDTGISVQQQLSLDRLLDATAGAGAPVRVAIIAHADDLGTVTPLWQKPQAYAAYLGYELSDAYDGRLLIVMPNGLGVYWHANPSGAAKLAPSLSALKPASTSRSALVNVTETAIYRIEAAAGVTKSTLAGSSGANAGSSSRSAAADLPAPVGAAANNSTPASHHRTRSAWFVLLVILLVLLYVGWRRGRLGKLRAATRVMRLRNELRGVRVRLVTLLPTVLLAIVVVALLLNQGGGGGSTATGQTLATNPHIDPGTVLGTRLAPNFTLTDQSGRPVSLSQYRGKAVILAFVDAECQTICPLTTQAMLDAKRDLGSAGRQLQLLGVNANWKSTQIDDVLNYTELHGMVGSWRFATGNAAQLEHVWKAYGVNEKALVTKADNAIDHVAALYVIDPQGHERVVFTTYPSYASVPQFGQLLARDVSRLLPGHPAVSTHYSYAEAPSTPPGRRAELPKLGGGSLTLGPGKPHLYLFFATWDQQTLALADDLDRLNAYAKAAKADGLPQLEAIDEGSVEPSARAMPEFIAKLPSRLSYPVAIDGSGRVADGYHVQGEPWFVETNARGRIVWFQEVYTEGWPPLTRLEQELKAALHKQRPISQAKALAGSPGPLAALHAQGSKLLGGGQQALDARIRALEADGYPVVLNIWSSWCGPCQAEFGLFAKASAEYGKRVAFLGADNADSAANAQAFLNGHHVSYPSYATTDTSIDDVLIGGLEGTPTTVYLVRGLKPVYVWSDPYESLGALQADISTYVLGRH